MAREKSQLYPSAQIVMRELEPGKLELLVMQSGPESLPYMLAKYFLSQIAAFADVSSLVQGLLEGKRLVVDKLDFCAGTRPTSLRVYELELLDGGALDTFANEARFGDRGWAEDYTGIRECDVATRRRMRAMFGHRECGRLVA